MKVRFLFYDNFIACIIENTNSRHYFLFLAGMRKFTLLKKIALTIIAFLIYSSSFSQQSANNAIHRNTVFVELASKGAIYSVNFDHIFRQGEKLNYSYRAGFSIEKNSIAFPIGISFITGQQSHHAEFSLTVIPFIDKYETFLSGDNVSDKYLYVVPSVGYRFQRPAGGFFLKAGIAPLILLDPPSDNFWKMDPTLYGYGSIGIGYTF